MNRKTHIFAFLVLIPALFAFSQGIWPEDLLETNNPLKRYTEKKIDEDTYIDNSINESEYYIGMGDVFSISLPSLPTSAYQGIVNQNCDILINSIGIVKMGRVSLFQAKDSLKSYMRKKLNRIDSVYVSLQKGKKVTVTLAGNIPNPGTKVLPGTYRILDAIRDDNNEKFPTTSTMNLRNVKCINKDSTIFLDLYKYLYKSDQSQNPYLYPGDHIYLDEPDSRVYLFGPVTNFTSGEFPILKGENIADILSFLNLDASADTSFVILQKGRDLPNRENIIIGQQDFNKYILEDRDVITIPVLKDYPRFMAINVSGEVKRPGSYPVLDANTTVSEVLDLAGGLTDQACFERAVIIRQSKTAPILDEKIAVSTMIRPEQQYGIKKMGLMKDYVIIPLKKYSEKLTLRANDKIVVPRIDDFIYISGNVKLPGPYSFANNKKLKNYIRDAGGYTSKADRNNIIVFSSYEDAFQFKSIDNLQQGDIIIVPDRQEYKRFTNILLPSIQALAAILTTAIGIYTVLQ